jgi:hypothetical protein
MTFGPTVMPIVFITITVVIKIAGNHPGYPDIIRINTGDIKDPECGFGCWIKTSVIDGITVTLIDTIQESIQGRW